MSQLPVAPTLQRAALTVTNARFLATLLGSLRFLSFACSWFVWWAASACGDYAASDLLAFTSLRNNEPALTPCLSFGHICTWATLTVLSRHPMFCVVLSQIVCIIPGCVVWLYLRISSLCMWKPADLDIHIFILHRTMPPPHFFLQFFSNY